MIGALGQALQLSRDMERYERMEALNKQYGEALIKNSVVKDSTVIYSLIYTGKREIFTKGDEETTVRTAKAVLDNPRTSYTYDKDSVIWFDTWLDNDEFDHKANLKIMDKLEVNAKEMLVEYHKLLKEANGNYNSEDIYFVKEVKGEDDDKT